MPRLWRTDGLYGWNFGLGKNLSSQRTWSETAVSAAVSAIALPVIRSGMNPVAWKKRDLRACDFDSSSVTYAAVKKWPTHFTRGGMKHSGWDIRSS